MAVFDFSDPSIVLPAQIVVDSSLLLALRADDDNPHAEAARAFTQRMAEQIAALTLVAWVPLPVLQECYHTILAAGIRRAWQAMDPSRRPPNWLAAYKRKPELLKAAFPEMAEFARLLTSIPFTPLRPEDLAESATRETLDDRMRHFIVRYHLLPQDALILAHAERLGVRAVATLDRDWCRAKAFHVYTIP